MVQSVLFVPLSVNMDDCICCNSFLATPTTLCPALHTWGNELPASSEGTSAKSPDERLAIEVLVSRMYESIGSHLLLLQVHLLEDEHEDHIVRFAIGTPECQYQGVATA